MLKPLADRIIVKREVVSNKSESGLILAGAQDIKSNQGTVLAVGPGKVVPGGILAVDLVVGDRVMFSAYAGTPILVDGEELLILNEADILAKY